MNPCCQYLTGSTSFGVQTKQIRNLASVGFLNFEPTCKVLHSFNLGVSPKIGACLLWIPRPVIGGVFAVMCSLPTAVGISTLQYANLNSSRNQFVIGFAIFMSFILPGFIAQNPEAISTKSDEFNELASVLLSTNMFVGGFFAVLFDNLLPGTPEERGKFLSSGFWTLDEN